MKLNWTVNVDGTITATTGRFTVTHERGTFYLWESEGDHVCRGTLHDCRAFAQLTVDAEEEEDLADYRTMLTFDQVYLHDDIPGAPSKSDFIHPMNRRNM